MALINVRWPSDLTPETCEFGRSRNDILQLSPRTRKEKVIRQGRPLWAARVSWSMPNTQRLAKLRYYLEGLDGYSGSVQLWDFSSPYPFGLDLATLTGTEKVRLRWTNSGASPLWTWAGLPSHWVPGNTVQLGQNVAAGDTTFNLQGLEASKLAAVQGQYIQIGRRLYVVTDNATSNGSGVVTITIQTPLLASGSTGDVVRLVEAGCEMRLAAQDWQADAGAGQGLVRVSASFIETFQDFA